MNILLANLAKGGWYLTKDQDKLKFMFKFSKLLAYNTMKVWNIAWMCVLLLGLGFDMKRLCHLRCPLTLKYIGLGMSFQKMSKTSKLDQGMPSYVNFYFGLTFSFVYKCNYKLPNTSKTSRCCIIWPGNGCFACCSLVEIICSWVKTSFFVFFVTNRFNAETNYFEQQMLAEHQFAGFAG